MKHICSYCEVGETSQVVYNQTVKVGRRSVDVQGLSKVVCGHCGEESVPLEMYDRNAELVERALARTPAELAQALLPRLREKWAVSQRDASLLMGAGVSAFGKWESGQTRMSDPAALLVHCALHVPGVMEHLATLVGVELREKVSLRKTRSGSEYNWAFHGQTDAPEKKVGASLKLVRVNAKSVASPAQAWRNEYFPVNDMRFAA